ncbi:MAG TPA: hypothetical protein VF826_17570 [Chloroflexia bacterium]|jgi:hypothetical protein
MANKEKRLLLIKELADFTRQGTLRWEKTSQQGTYMSTFPNSAVRISRKGVSLPQEVFSLQIIDGKGDVTETVTGDLFANPLTPEDADPSRSYFLLEQLYREISRQVEAESDKTIDDVFAELKRLSAEGAKAS